MKIEIIVPSNKSSEINRFINDYNSLKKFNKKSHLTVIGNGEVRHSSSDKFIRYKDKFDIVPFTKLRGIAMENSDADYFLFLDDDHLFLPGSDGFLMNCISFLRHHKDCGVLQLEKQNKDRNGFYIKSNAHIWTSRGLFIKNIKDKFDFKEYYKLDGACEDLLYGYEVLNNGYLPYCIYNTPIKRGCKLPNNHKELNDPSYNKKILDKNIIGYIRNKYNQKEWPFYGSLDNLGYPNNLRYLIKNQLSNLI